MSLKETCSNQFVEATPKFQQTKLQSKIETYCSDFRVLPFQQNLPGMIPEPP